MPTKCTATNRDGSACNAYAVTESDYCFHHDPDRAADRRQARSKGGRARHGRRIGPVGQAVPPGQAGPVVRAGPLPLDTMGDVATLLQDAINTTLQLENSIHRARTIGYLAGLLIKALDFSTLEERLTQVERALNLRDPAL